MRDFLNNVESEEQPAINYQAHILNYQKDCILHREGIRELVLRRNNLGDGFARAIAQTLSYEKYIRAVDVTGNQITEDGLTEVIKTGLMENQTLLCFDARINPGFTSEKVRK